MTERIRCLVPFCRRTTAAGRFSEWVCGRHWRQVSRRLRTRYHRAKRRALRRGRAEDAARAVCLWLHCREQAIGRGALA